MTLALCAACGGPVARAPEVTLQLRPGTGVQHLAQVAASRGYPVVVMQPELGRFGVQAFYRRGMEDDTGYRFAVECQGALCRVTPYGPRAERTPNGWLLPPGLRDEVADFQALLQSVAVR